MAGSYLPRVQCSSSLHPFGPAENLTGRGIAIDSRGDISHAPRITNNRPRTILTRGAASSQTSVNGCFVDPLAQLACNPGNSASQLSTRLWLKWRCESGCDLGNICYPRRGCVQLHFPRSHRVTHIIWCARQTGSGKKFGRHVPSNMPSYRRQADISVPVASTHRALDGAVQLFDNAVQYCLGCFAWSLDRLISRSDPDPPSTLIISSERGATCGTRLGAPWGEGVHQASKPQLS